MITEVHLSQLKRIIGLSERAAQKNSTLPVLSCLLLETKKNILMVKATNLDVGIEAFVPAKSDGDWSVAVPAHTISSFVSQLNDQDGVVKMELASGNLHITSKRSKVTIKTVSPEDFPSIPRVSDSKKTSLSSEVLVKGLKSVWYSASISSVKPELSSVYIYKNAENLVFAATDSFRLAEKKMKLPNNTVFEDILIPLKNISDIIRILESANSDVTINSNKNLISFEIEGVYLTSRVIDGTFPDYRQIVPKGYTTEAVALKQDVINSIKVSNVFTDKFNQVRFIIDPKGKSFEIQTKNSDIGENATAVDAALSGEKVEINFNGKYVSDCFQSVDADSVSFQLSGLNKPMVIRPASGDGTFMYLVMPMNR
jgi:DNA polymerase-3 subunit beta